MNPKNVAARFNQSLLPKRVAYRFAMQFNSPDELKGYLHDHPNADPSNHTVVKQKDKKPKTQKPEIDAGPAEHASSAAKARFEDNKKTFQSIKKLPSKDKKWLKGYKDIEAAGTKAADAAKAMLKQYANMADGQKGNAKRQREAMLDYTDHMIQNWHRTKDSFGGSSEERLANLYAGAQQLEAGLQALPKMLKGDNDVAIDDSWREH